MEREHWICDHCDTENDAAATTCSKCHFPRGQHLEKDLSRLTPPLDNLPPLRNRSIERNLAPVVAGVITLVVYVVLEAISEQVPIVQKLTQRGWTPHAAVFLTFWAGYGLLWERLRFIRRHNRYLDEAPTAPSSNDVEEKLNNPNDELLSPRMYNTLECFKTTRNMSEVREVTRDMNDADFVRMDLRYSLVRLFVWAIPILGFIGTVIGIGGAVGGFAKFLSAAQDIEEIRDALSKVSDGLGVAFDTTLVALCLSLLVMGVMSIVEQAETRMLFRVEKYVAGFVAHLSTQLRVPATKEPEDSRELRKIFESLPEQISAALVSAAKTIADGWDSSGREWLGGLKELESRLVEFHDQQLTTVKVATDESQTLRQSSEEMIRQTQTLLSSVNQEFRTTLERGSREIGDVVQKQHNMVQQYSGALLRAGGKFDELITLQNQLEEGLLRVSGSEGITTVLNEVRHALDELTPLVRRLAEEGTPVEVTFVAGLPEARR